MDKFDNKLSSSKFTQKFATNHFDSHYSLRYEYSSD